jgi:hypothetical protein
MGSLIPDQLCPCELCNPAQKQGVLGLNHDDNSYNNVVTHFSPAAHFWVAHPRGSAGPLVRGTACYSAAAAALSCKAGLFLQALVAAGACSAICCRLVLTLLRGGVKISSARLVARAQEVWACWSNGRRAALAICAGECGIETAFCAVGFVGEGAAVGGAAAWPNLHSNRCIDVVRKAVCIVDQQARWCCAQQTVLRHQAAVRIP